MRECVNCGHGYGVDLLVCCGCKCHIFAVTPVTPPSDVARKAAFKEAIAVIVGLPTEHYTYSGPYSMEASTFRDNAIKALEAALVVGRSKTAQAVPVVEGDEEREFLAASVAVWREIDKGGPPLDSSVALRKRERAAWERYRATLDG